ncbi:hypothetical protein ACX0G7_08390 [Flavitalea antarctica]
MHELRALVVVYAFPTGHVEGDHTITHGDDLTTTIQVLVDSQINRVKPYR